MVLRVVEQQGEPVSSGAQPLHGGIQTTEEIWVGGGVVRVDSGGWRREEERTRNTCVTLRQASRDESLVPFRGWRRDDAKAEKYLTRGKPDQGVWVHIFPQLVPPL